MTTKLTRAYVTITSIGIMLLLLIVLGFIVLPFTGGNDDLQIISQVETQVARAEFLAKETLILAYRPATFHSEAVNGLQTTLPDFERVQTGLLKGDAALGLPANPADDVTRAILRTSNDYQAIDAALKAILARPDQPTDIVQVDIIVQHEILYGPEMYQVVLLLQQHAQSWQIQLLIIRIVIIVIALMSKIGNYLLVTRVVMHEQGAEQEGSDASTL